MTVVKRYGHIADKADPRDREFRLRAARPPALPPSVDLRKWCPPTMTQGDLGACTAHAITGVLRWHVKRSGGMDAPLSRLQLYYDERDIEKTVGDDSGAEIRDGIKCVKTLGVGHEDLWPYDVARFKDKPPADVYKFAGLWGALTYERVPVSTIGLKTALASGFPVVIGISVYDSFESDAVEKTGIVPMPDTDNEDMAGGHCMACYGYGQKPGYFTVQNSWGVDWGGNKGFCVIPEEYLGSRQFGSDYWIIKNLGE